MLFNHFISFAVIILGTAVHFNAASEVSRQPEFSIKAEMNKAFDKSCNIGTFKIPKTTDGAEVAVCLEHCLANCRCKSFHICHNTLCELCSTNKIETASLLSDTSDCIYATYEIQHLAGGLQVSLTCH